MLIQWLNRLIHNILFFVLFENIAFVTPPLQLKGYKTLAFSQHLKPLSREGLYRATPAVIWNHEASVFVVPFKGPPSLVALYDKQVGLRTHGTWWLKTLHHTQTNPFVSFNVQYMFIPVSTVQYKFLSISTVLCGASVPQCHPTSGALPRILSTGQEGENSDNQPLSTVTNIHLSTSLRFRAVLITSLTLSSLLKSNLMYALPTNCYWLWCTWNFPTACK